MKKIKVLIGCLFFKEFTGSEMYVYELAKNLMNLNCDVSIISPNIGGPLTNLGLNDGIKIYSVSNPPTNEKFDIIHGQHYPVVQFLLNLFPNVPKICTIHSEIISLENPVKDISIFKYIAIRPEIKEHLIKNFGLLERQIEVVYNPVDSERFNTNNTSDKGYTLFVGTIDNLRKQTIFDLINYTEKNKKELWVVGKNHSNYLESIKSMPHVKYFSDTFNVEKFVKDCTETAGILLGRTTIEGWMCNKPGWIYNVESSGYILDKKLHTPPTDVSKFDSIEVAKKIKEEYIKVLN